MNKEQINTFFSQVLNKLWPKWNNNDYQVATWARILKKLDFKTAERAAQDHYLTKEANYGHPKLYAIIEKARQYQPRTSADAESKTPILAFYLQRSGDGHKVPFYMDAAFRNNYDAVSRTAEYRRQQAEKLYGGQWIVIQQSDYWQTQNEDNKTKQHKTTPQPQPLVISDS